MLKSEENQELESIAGILPKNIRNIEIKNEADDIKKWEEKNNQKDLIYRENKYAYKENYDFQQFETIDFLVIVFIVVKLI